MFKTICISSFCFSNILKMLVKIQNCSTLRTVGSCLSVYMLAIHVFTVSSCVGSSSHHRRHSINITRIHNIPQQEKWRRYKQDSIHCYHLLCLFRGSIFRSWEEGLRDEREKRNSRNLSQGLTPYITYISNNNKIQENETYASGIWLIPLFPSLNCGLSQLKSMPLSWIIHTHTACI